MNFWAIDAVPLAVAMLAGLACALVGNILILTRRAMAADAISHSIVPGIVAAAAVFGAVSGPLALLFGLVAAFAASGLTAFLIRAGRVEPNAALGVVFTTFFAAGIMALEWTGLARTGFDIHTVVTGQMETLIWLAATGPASLVDPAALASLPGPVGVSAAALLGILGLFAVFGRRLAILAFDPVFARASGLGVAGLEAALVAATAIAAVAAFQSVGVVLAVAMFVCPPATARLLTRRLGPQIAVSLVVAVGTVGLGYAIAVVSPQIFGSDLSLSAAGTIGATAGLTLALAAMLRSRA